MSTLGLEKLPGRCPDGYDIATQHPRLCLCGAMSGDWATFTTALRSVVRADGTVHQGDVRPLIRGKVAPKSIGQFYRRAKAADLIADTGEREPSNDAAGRNLDKLDRVYLWRGEAA